MKSLTLFRHGKSGWDSPVSRDFDRPINERGIKGSRLMGEHALSLGLHWDHVVSSPAVRCTETLDGFWDGYGRILHPNWDRRIYLASGATLLDVVHDLPDEETEGRRFPGPVLHDRIAVGLDHVLPGGERRPQREDRLERRNFLRESELQRRVVDRLGLILGLAVGEARGEGLSRTIWRQVTKANPVFWWRSRTVNGFNAFYNDVCTGSVKMGMWTVFWIGEKDWNRIEAIAPRIAQLPASFVG